MHSSGLVDNVHAVCAVPVEHQEVWVVHESLFDFFEPVDKRFLDGDVDVLCTPRTAQKSKLITSEEDMFEFLRVKETMDTSCCFIEARLFHRLRHL